MRDAAGRAGRADACADLPDAPGPTVRPSSPCRAAGRRPCAPSLPEQGSSARNASPAVRRGSGRPGKPLPFRSFGTSGAIRRPAAAVDAGVERSRHPLRRSACIGERAPCPSAPPPHAPRRWKSTLRPAAQAGIARRSAPPAFAAARAPLARAPLTRDRLAQRHSGVTHHAPSPEFPLRRHRSEPAGRRRCLLLRFHGATLSTGWKDAPGGRSEINRVTPPGCDCVRLRCQPEVTMAGTEVIPIFATVSHA